MPETEITDEMVRRAHRAFSKAVSESGADRVAAGFRVALAAVAPDIDRAGYERGVRAALEMCLQVRDEFDATSSMSYAGGSASGFAERFACSRVTDRILALLEAPDGWATIRREGPGRILPPEPEDPRVPALIEVLADAVQWLLEREAEKWMNREGTRASVLSDAIALARAEEARRG